MNAWMIGSQHCLKCGTPDSRAVRRWPKYSLATLTHPDVAGKRLNAAGKITRT